jgi:hypothetical protein
LSDLLLDHSIQQLNHPARIKTSGSHLLNQARDFELEAFPFTHCDAVVKQILRDRWIGAGKHLFETL